MSSFISRIFPRAPAWLEIGELHRRLGEGETPLIIDVRQPEEFSAAPGHLPGARNVPLGDLPGQAADLAALGRPVVVVCKTDRRSARGSQVLSDAGVAEVLVLRGGTDGWYEQGLPLEL